MTFQRFGIAIKRWMQQPRRVALCCGFFLAVSLLANGLLWRLWGLHRDLDRLNTEIVEINRESAKIQSQLKLAKDPSFIEQQAKDKLDLVGENELVFVFADNSSDH